MRQCVYAEGERWTRVGLGQRKIPQYTTSHTNTTSFSVGVCGRQLQVTTVHTVGMCEDNTAAWCSLDAVNVVQKIHLAADTPPRCASVS